MIILISKATKDDLPKILELQKLSFKNNVLDNPNSSPCKQSLQDITIDFQKGVILKVLGSQDAILGSIRAYNNEGTVRIEKLFVNPENRHHQIASELLRKIELCFHAKRFELCTSDIELSKLFEPQGYKAYKTSKSSNDTTLYYFEKWR